MHAVFERTAGQSWKPSEFLLTAKGCGIVNKTFPYPVSDVAGTMKKLGEDLVINMSGRAGGRNVSIAGLVKSPGPLSETSFEIDVKQFPLDDRFKQAPPRAAEVQSVIDQTDLSGWADVHLTLYRPPGPGQKFITKIESRLANCEILLKAFPIPRDETRRRRVVPLGPQALEVPRFSRRTRRGQVERDGRVPAGRPAGQVGLWRSPPKEPLSTKASTGPLPENVKTVWNNFAPPREARYGLQNQLGSEHAF